jgi:hypothetical protein
MTTPADIDQLLLGRENENLEFKHAANSFDFELLLLKHLERFGPSSMKDLQDVVPSSDRRSILKILNALKAAGKVLLEGEKRGAKWRISGQNELKSATKPKASASSPPERRRQKSVKTHE